MRAVTLSWAGKGGAAPEVEGAAATAWASTDGEDQLLLGDNLAALTALCRTHEQRVTLAYMDPPFFTNRVHEAQLLRPGARRGTRGGRERHVAFDDRWTDRAAYLEALAPRIRLVRRLLAPWGSFVIHVDPKVSHYVKVLCDELFGEDCFASEIVWRYRRWPTRTPNFQRVHDVLLRYRRDASTPPRWNVLYEPLAASTLATWGTSKQRADFDASGHRRRSTRTQETSRGVPIGDVWDIGVIAPISRERTGYPSQKPEALLERLVTALSAPGDVVVDPYLGSGTTAVVAARLGRRFVGVDQSEIAVEVARKRILGVVRQPVASGAARVVPSETR
jgi:site-specific DNA-methyltransferase (adenine-specific)